VEELWLPPQSHARLAWRVQDVHIWPGKRRYQPPSVLLESSWCPKTKEKHRLMICQVQRTPSFATWTLHFVSPPIGSDHTRLIPDHHPRSHLGISWRPEPSVAVEGRCESNLPSGRTARTGRTFQVTESLPTATRLKPPESSKSRGDVRWANLRFRGSCLV
jgi:hypothetical protein